MTPILHSFLPQLTSQDHTPEVIRRALEKHNMEDFSCQEFSLCQTLKCGKGQFPHKLTGPTEKKLHLFTCLFSFPSSVCNQSSRSQIRPTYFTLCVPPPTTTLCSVSDGEATGDVLAPLPAPEMQPRTPMPSEKCLRTLNIRTAQSSSEQLTCISRTNNYLELGHRRGRRDSLGWKLPSPRGHQCRDGEMQIGKRTLEFVSSFCSLFL